LYIEGVAIRHVIYDAGSFGVGELWLEGDRLVAHLLPRESGSEPQTWGHPLAERLRRYFAGERVAFEDVELDEDDRTPFQRDVAEALRAVPYGEVVSYGELAALAGHPNAQRAAGSFCAGNRFPIVVPCHRVVAADGIGSFGSLGIEYKRRLLGLEGVAL
jgi:methylated-DNA-[protein]-cysteine S-methyltransferase